MNRRHRQRAHARRTQHQQATRDPHRPLLILRQDAYPTVERAHIVPRMYQNAFAVQGKVAVHSVSQPSCTLLTTKKAGTRPAYYRRLRPDGKEIDDIEASLAAIESRSAPFLQATAKGAALDLEAKGALAQFFAIQAMRGPAFFEQREEVLAPMVEEVEESQFQPEALAAVGGDVEAAREKLLDLYMDPTTRFMYMFQKAGKIAGVLGNMRWHVVRFADPVVAYSDHPVVLWPVGLATSAPFGRQHLGPLGAIEVRVPIAPDRGIIMNWVDLPDSEAVLEVNAAAELNAFTVSQADEEWMHTPGHEPPVATGTFSPISRILAPSYTPESMTASKRREHAASWIEKNKNRDWINQLRLIDLKL